MSKFDYRIKLIPDLVDIIDIYTIPWGEYEMENGKLVGLNSLQEEYLKQDLESIIKEKIPLFEMKISLNDIKLYNELTQINNCYVNLYNSAGNGSFPLVLYYNCIYEYDEEDYKIAVRNAYNYGHHDIAKYCEKFL